MNVPATTPPHLTVDDFLKAFAGRPEKYELVDGVPHMMARAKRRHVQIMGNLLWRLKERLQGGPCDVMAADMGLKVSEDTYRLPDVAIYCDPRDLGPQAADGASGAVGMARVGVTGAVGMAGVAVACV